MPGVSEFEAMGQIKTACLGLPAILFTGFDEDCLRDDRARLAIACVEKKAGDLVELKLAVARALAYGDLSNSLGRLGLPALHGDSSAGASGQC